MSLYRLARPLLFALDPETAHRFTLRALDFFPFTSVLSHPVKAMGIEFPNPVGLAAGLDKNAEHIDALARLGFGFIEVGTVTPRPQPGNPRPRMFRIPQAGAIINRLGFNNIGVDAFLRNVERARWKGILGINIGRNTDTPAGRAVEDYEICLDKVYASASYVAINVSSPNTDGLRSLQERDSLDNLLLRLTEKRKQLEQRHGKRIPLALKVAPDLDAGQVKAIAAAVRRHRIEGVIATNTSLSRDGVENMENAKQAGGLSGAPIKIRATEILRGFALELKGEAALIGAGGIMSGADAGEKFAAGATLVQIYSGLVYRGPELIARCVPA